MKIREFLCRNKDPSQPMDFQRNDFKDEDDNGLVEREGVLNNVHYSIFTPDDEVFKVKIL